MAPSDKTSAQPTADDLAAAHAVYTAKTLRLYDLLVLGLSNRFIWKCPTPAILDWYNQHISANHLDVGVGTGFFLDRCAFPSDKPRLGLLDINVNCLDTAAKRVARYHPEVFEASILEPIDLGTERFDSIGLNYVLHCLPGSFSAKSAAFTSLAPWLNPTGTLFGSTLIGDGVKRGWAARRLMKVYNQKQIFSNAQDTLEELHRELNQRFTDVKVETRGCVALFSGRAG